MKLEIRKRGFMFPLHYIYFIFYITFYVLTSHFLRFYIPYKPTALTFKSDWEKKKKSIIHLWETYAGECMIMNLFQRETYADQSYISSQSLFDKRADSPYE